MRWYQRLAKESNNYRHMLFPMLYNMGMPESSPNQDNPGTLRTSDVVASNAPLGAMHSKQSQYRGAGYRGWVQRFALGPRATYPGIGTDHWNNLCTFTTLYNFIFL